MAAPYSTAVVAGTYADAPTQINLRKDALTRWLKFEIPGTLAIGNKQGGSFICPFTGTVINHYLKTTSGGATVRTQKDGVDIDNSMAATSTASIDSSPVSAAVTKGQLITMDITAISSGVDLVVQMEILCT